MRRPTDTARALYRAALTAALLLPLPSSGALHAQLTLANSRNAPKDPMQNGLPLAPSRTLNFTTNSGHWMSLDVSPDGRMLVFDLLGDIYTMPVAGGTATPLTRGMAFDGQPRFSPDGKKIVFVSDRDGGWNVWTLSLDKPDTTQITRGKTFNYVSPEWTPDGKYILVTRGTKLWMFHAAGGSGQQVIRTQLQPGQQDNIRQAGAAFGKDGRYIWFSQRAGVWLYNTPLGDYQLAMYDRETGQTAVRSNRWGSAFRPTPSPDGKWLVYGSRHIDTTRLRIRNLDTGDERWLVMKVQRDDQESAATLDVLPGMSFTPDSRFVIATWDGKLWKVPVESGEPSEIPFQAEVRQALAPAVHFEYPITDSATFVVKQIRDAAPSPDGKRLALVSLGRLHMLDLAACMPPAGTRTDTSAMATARTAAGCNPRRVTDANHGEYDPAWSPDGQWLTYTTWSNADGGHLYKVATDGRGRPQRLTTRSAYYQAPVWSPDGRRVVAVRGPARAYQEALAGGIPGGAEDLVWVAAAGGEANFIAPAGGLGTPHFTSDSTRIYLYGGQRGLVSMRWDGTDPKAHLRVTGPAAPGGGGGPGGPGGGGPPAQLILMAPEGDQALAQVGNDLYVVTVPLLGGAEPTINVGGAPDATSFPARKLTDIGGQFPAWSWDSRQVHWSIGNAHVVYDLEQARAFEDSLRLAQRAQAVGAGTGDSARADSGRRDAAPNAQPRAPGPQYKPIEARIRITAERDTPRGVAVLRGARVVTMKGDEVIENADVVIRDNRIAALGPNGSVQIPAGARVIDVSGKTILPGYVDAHAHLRAAFGVHRDQVWSYAANLAFGVTTARDPQTATTDVLTYEDQVVAGRVLGPRIYSTGPGVFGAGNPTGQNVRDLDHARSILKRYSEYYDTKTIKQYVVGNREQRQWIIQAARELRLMPTTEGSLDIKMNVTEMIDGYSGHEHSIPTFPLQSDLIRLLAESGMVYTPTILVSYGGPWAENYFYATEDVAGDAKLRRFTPWNELEAKMYRRGGPGGQAGWFHPSQHVMKPISASLRDLVAAGGKIGVGSHGQLQGLGYHWELWSMASGGLSNRDALRAATIMGAEAIGLGKELGSVESGKLADLVVLDSNPLDNIRNSKAIRYVVKNGRVYDGETLDEVWPRAKKVDRFYWVAEEER